MLNEFIEETKYIAVCHNSRSKIKDEKIDRVSSYLLDIANRDENNVVS